MSSCRSAPSAGLLGCAALLALTAGCFVNRDAENPMPPALTTPPPFIFPPPRPGDCSTSFSPLFIDTMIVQTTGDANSLFGVDCVQGSVVISGFVNDLNGLSTITQISGTLTVDDADALLSLAQLGSLRFLGGLDVANNDALSSLGFASLTSVGGDVRFADDPALFDLSTELRTLATIGGTFTAAGLPQASGCDLLALASRAAASSLTNVAACVQDAGTLLDDAGSLADGGAFDAGVADDAGETDDAGAIDAGPDAG